MCAYSSRSRIASDSRDLLLTPTSTVGMSPCPGPCMSDVLAVAILAAAIGHFRVGHGPEWRFVCFGRLSNPALRGGCRSDEFEPLLHTRQVVSADSTVSCLASSAAVTVRGNSILKVVSFNSDGCTLTQVPGTFAGVAAPMSASRCVRPAIASTAKAKLHIHTALRGYMAPPRGEARCITRPFSSHLGSSGAKLSAGVICDVLPILVPTRRCHSTVGPRHSQDAHTSSLRSCMHLGLQMNCSSKTPCAHPSRPRARPWAGRAWPPACFMARRPTHTAVG